MKLGKISKCLIPNITLYDTQFLLLLYTAMWSTPTEEKSPLEETDEASASGAMINHLVKGHK